MNLLKLLRATLALFILFSTFLFSSGKAQPYGFIAEKHPECVSLSNQPYEDDSAAEYVHAIQTGGVPLILKAFQYGVYDPALFERAEKEAEQTADMERTLFKNQQLSKRFKHPFFKVLDKFKINAKTTIGFDILLTALQLDYQLRILTKKPEESVGVIFLGRTPYFYQMFLEAIQKNHPHHDSSGKQYTPLQDEGFDLIHLAYSGHPDAISLREYQRQDQAPKVNAGNLVTEQRLNHFHSYMQSKNLHTYDRLVIVDMMEKGSGMSRFLTILKTFYAKMDTPYKTPLFMHLTRVPGFTPPMEEGGVLYRRDECFYRFPENKKLNYDKHFLPFIEIHAATTTLGNCTENDFIQYAACGGMYYPAQRWSPEYDVRRDDGAPLMHAVKTALAPMIQGWLARYKRLYQAAL